MHTPVLAARARRAHTPIHRIRDRKTVPKYETFKYWQHIEIFFNVCFTLEMLMRVVCAHSVRKTVKDIYFVFDFLSVFPTWFEVRARAARRSRRARRESIGRARPFAPPRPLCSLAWSGTCALVSRRSFSPGPLAAAAARAARASSS